MNDEEKQILSEIINALYSQGYQPYDQIYGYVKTGNELYITRKNDVRRKIKTLDETVLEQYLKENV